LDANGLAAASTALPTAALLPTTSEFRHVLAKCVFRSWRCRIRRRGRRRRRKRRRRRRRRKRSERRRGRRRKKLVKRREARVE